MSFEDSSVLPNRAICRVSAHETLHFALPPSPGCTEESLGAGRGSENIRADPCIIYLGSWVSDLFLPGNPPGCIPEFHRDQNCALPRLSVIGIGLHSLPKENDEDCTIGINQVLGEDLGGFAESRAAPNRAAPDRPAPKDSAPGHAGPRQDGRLDRNIGRG